MARLEHICIGGKPNPKRFPLLKTQGDIWTFEISLCNDLSQMSPEFQHSKDGQIISKNIV
jgi:hypothetical protein